MQFMVNNGNSVWEDYATVCGTHAVSLADLGFETEHGVTEYGEPGCCMCDGWEPTLMTLEQEFWMDVVVANA